MELRNYEFTEREDRDWKGVWLMRLCLFVVYNGMELKGGDK